MIKDLRLLGVGIVLSLASVTFCTGAQASTTSAVVAAGTVNLDGRPASSTVFTLSAWPTTAHLHSLRPGQRIVPVLMDTEHPAPSGSVTLRAATGVSADYVDPNGTVNYDLDVSTGSTSFSYQFPVAAGHRADFSVDLARHTIRALDVAATTVSSVRALAAGQALYGAVTTTMSVAPQVGQCYWVKTSTTQRTSDLHTIVDGWVYGPGDLYEKVDSEHTLGIAEQYGTDGWTQSGSASLYFDNSSTASTGKLSATRFYANTENYSYWVCGGSFRMWHPDSPYALLAGYHNLPHSSQAYCTTYAAGQISTLSTGTGQGHRYLSGVGLDVLNVSAEADWSVGVQITFTADPRYRQLFCGDSPSGPASSQVVSLSQG